MCLNIKEGVLGLRDFYLLNQALLSRQGWKLNLNQIPCYHPFLNLPITLFEFYLSRRPSQLWRGLQWAKQLLNKWIGWRVGNGINIFIWHDNWLPDNTLFKPLLHHETNTLKMWMNYFVFKMVNGNGIQAWLITFIPPTTEKEYWILQSLL